MDKELNKAAYGLEVGPQELLSTLGQGGAPAPAQFAAVYDKLNEVSMQSVWVDGRGEAVQGRAGWACMCVRQQAALLWHEEGSVLGLALQPVHAAPQPTTFKARSHAVQQLSVPRG